MQKIISILALCAAFVFAPMASPIATAQSSYEVRQTVKEQSETIAALQSDNEALTVDIERVSGRSDSLSMLVSQLTETVRAIIQNPAAFRNPVNSQENANILFGVLFGLLNLIITGLSLAYKPFKAFVEKYASKSALAVFNGVIFAIIAAVIGQGETGIVEILGYLVTIIGTHFGAFTAIKKSTPATA